MNSNSNSSIWVSEFKVRLMRTANTRISLACDDANQIFEVINHEVSLNENFREISVNRSVDRYRSILRNADKRIRIHHSGNFDIIIIFRVTR